MCKGAFCCVIDETWRQYGNPLFFDNLKLCSGGPTKTIVIGGSYSEADRDFRYLFCIDLSEFANGRRLL